MLGLADNYVPSAKLEILSDRLAALPARSNKAEVSDVVASVAETPPDGAIWPQRDLIDRLFAFHRIEDILAALDREGSGFAAKTTDILKTKSPLSLHVTLRMLRLGRRSARLEECLEREFAATGAVLRNNDFYEGIRAAIVDKDRNPEWQPSSMSDVTEEQIAAYFPAEHSGLFEI
jgi:enoyl-CoA hydratase